MYLYWFIISAQKILCLWGVSNLWPLGCMQPRMPVKVAQHKVVNLLKHYEIFVWLHVTVYLMWGPRQLFFLQHGTEMPRGRTPLDITHWIVCWDIREVCKVLCKNHYSEKVTILTSIVHTEIHLLHAMVFSSSSMNLEQLSFQTFLLFVTDIIIQAQNYLIILYSSTYAIPCFSNNSGYYLLSSSYRRGNYTWYLTVFM